VKKNRVEVRTLDDYAEVNGVRSIDILKSDTQGFDLEVLKGARSLMAANRIHMIYMEIIFSDMYKNLPPFDEIFRFAIENNFKLVALYQFAIQNNVASWADALFVNPEYEKEDPSPAG
jgi:hypothetical protein